MSPEGEARETLLLKDHAGQIIRLTPERLEHIKQHPELPDPEVLVREALLHPASVVRSTSDPQIRLYYRRETTGKLAGKLVCIVVKTSPGDAFVVTAYLTDTIKKGEILWTSAP